MDGPICRKCTQLELRGPRNRMVFHSDQAPRPKNLFCRCAYRCPARGATASQEQLQFSFLLQKQSCRHPRKSDSLAESAPDKRMSLLSHHQMSKFREGAA